MTDFKYQAILLSTTGTMTSLWARIVATHDAHTIDFVGAIIVQLLCFWLPSAIYLSLDRLAPAFSARHKIQPAPKQPSASEIRHCAAVVLRNQAINVGVALLLTLRAARAGDPPIFRVDAALPSLAELARDLVLCCVVREVLFYYAHRTLHSPRLYRVIHKTHHRFTAPVALAAQYAHPLEHIVANTLPVILPPVVLRTHVLTFWAFLGSQLLETCTVHSGYDFFGGAARMHDAHHEKFNVHYGALGIMDWLHGTDGSKKGRKVE